VGQEWSQEALPSQEPCQEQADSQALASALGGAMQQAGVVGNVSIIEEKITSLPSPAAETKDEMEAERADATLSISRAEFSLRQIWRGARRCAARRVVSGYSNRKALHCDGDGYKVQGSLY
jgi:hypothetical protein